MTSLDSLLGGLLGVPALPGARCRGRHRLFDLDPVDSAPQRHAQALTLCSGCSALQACGDWLDSLTPARRPTGVVAGRIVPDRAVRKPKSPARNGDHP